MLDLLGMLLDRVSSFAALNWPLLAAAIGIDMTVRRGRGRFVLRALVRAVPRGVWFPAAISLAISIALFARNGVPVPPLEDEYSHLLLADTLRHGRLANPPHPLHEHFETMVVLQEPHYASPYPPGNGIALALFPLPIAGMWVMTALAVAAIAWAANAVLPGGWSALAGLLTAIHPAVVHTSQIYNSSAVPLLGGALCAGALWRMRAHPSQTLGAIAAAGAVILANSRPFEGLVLVVALALTNLRAFRRCWSAGAIVLAAGALATGVYNQAVTGNAFELPHALYDRVYNPWPTFAWEKPHRVAPYLSDEMRGDYARWYAPLYRRYSFAHSADAKVFAMTNFVAPQVWGGLRWLFAGPLLLAGRRRRIRPLLVAFLLFQAAPLSIVWLVQPHYVAPGGVLVAVIFTALLRDAAAVRWQPLVLSLVVIAAAAAAVAAATHVNDDGPSRERERRTIERELARFPGDDLIVVPQTIHGCVYNGADIDAQRVVWARQLGGEKDAELLRYYSRRRVWLLGERDGRLFVTPTGGSSVPPRPQLPP